MSRVKDVLLLVISEQTIKNKFGWLEGRMGQRAVSTFLIKHPEFIQSDLDFVGMEVDVGAMSFDLLFRKGKTYYVVEVTRFPGIDTKARRRKVLLYAQQFEKYLIEKFEPECESIIPILVTTSQDRTD